MKTYTVDKLDLERVRRCFKQYSSDIFQPNSAGVISAKGSASLNLRSKQQEPQQQTQLWPCYRTGDTRHQVVPVSASYNRLVCMPKAHCLVAYALDP